MDDPGCPTGCSPTLAGVTSEKPAVADRIAWTYLATVLSGAVGGLIAVVAYQLVNPLACPIVDEDAADLALTCSVGWAAVLMLLGFAGTFVGALFLLKIERRLATWLAMVAGLLWLAVGLSGIGEWWWILILVLLPALAALVSAPWPRVPPRVQPAVLAGVLVAALAVLIGQFTAF